MMPTIKIAAIVATFAAAAADGLILREPAVLYKGPSAQTEDAVFILSAGYPLQEISRVDGWRKVFLPTGENGWVRESRVQTKTAAVIIVDMAPVRQSADNSARTVFYVRRGVFLEVRQTLPGWLEVVHADGESGYISDADVWINY